MKIVKEFKEFIMRGNVMDLAVGVIIGGAFGAIVTAFIDNMIMPFIGLLTGGMDFSQQFIVLKAPDGMSASDIKSIEQAKEVGANVWGYGAFITAVINFLIIDLVIFLIVKAVNKGANLRKKEEEAEPTTKVCPFCCTEIDIKATRCPHCTSELPELES